MSKSGAPLNLARESGQPVAFRVLCAQLCEEGVEILPNDLVQHGLLGLSAQK